MANSFDFLEKDLFPPVSDFFENLGYNVFGEVNGCDLIAKKSDEMIIVELKKAFCLKLVYQAVNRQELSDLVYVAVGRSEKGMRDSSFKNMIKLLKRLDIGLITVAMDSPVKTVDVILEPKAIKCKSGQKKRMLKIELNGRSENLNNGGVNRTEIVTAYREKSIELLCLTDKIGTITNKMLKQAGYENKNISILYKNYYGWFLKTGKAEYTVSDKGKTALNEEKYSRLVEVYSLQAENKIKAMEGIN
ncbi:DUF2161 family putative PD-(D/E)XK-type phosphodiesterase [Anaerotignum faecicola]|nr:DUF2161 family putative PD-(D/E)XK-type phosphodiesterase [Anaerotignum faecicola]